MLLFETGMRKISEERILPTDVYDKIIDELRKLSSKIESLAKSNRRILKVQEEILSSLSKSSYADYIERTVIPDRSIVLKGICHNMLSEFRQSSAHLLYCSTRRSVRSAIAALSLANSG